MGSKITVYERENRYIDCKGFCPTKRETFAKFAILWNWYYGKAILTAPSRRDPGHWSFVRKTLLGPRPKPHLKLACKPVDYTCKLAVYTCKVLNFRFTSVTLITLLDTVEVTPFFSQFSGKLHVIHCKLPVYTCKLLVYTCKLPVYSKAVVYNL